MLAEMVAERMVRFVLAHRRAFVAIILVSIAGALFSARNIRIRFTFRDFYDYPGNPDVPLLDRYEKEFGDPAGTVDVLLISSNAFQPEVLSYIQSLTAALEQEPQFSSVSSLTNAVALVGESGAAPHTEPLIPHLPASREELSRARNIATHSPLFVHHLVSEQASLTLVRARMKQLSPSVDDQRAAVEASRRAIATVPTTHALTARVVGAPLVAVRMTDPLMRDQLKFMPLAVLLILVALSLTFRSLFGVALPFATVLTALLWTAGIFPLLGRPMDLISSVIPATLLVYGAVDPIFVMTRFLQKLEAGRTREQSIVESYAELTLPCFLTSLTTALGFFSFALLRLPLLRVFGLAVGIGASLAFVTTLIVLPLLLVSLPLPKTRFGESRISRWIDRALQFLWRVVRSRRPVVIGLAVATLLLFGALGRKQRISVAYHDLLPAAESRTLIRYVEERLDGLGRTALLIEGAPGSVTKPEVLRAMATVGREAKRHSIVTSVTSLSDLISTTTAKAIENPPSLDALHAVTREYVNDDASHAQIVVRFTDEGSEKWRTLYADLSRTSAREFAGLPVQVSFTGFSTVLFPVLDRAVVETLYGAALGFTVIVLLQLLIFRSLKLALISILPNLIPTAACFALMAATGVGLRIGSVLFLSVSLGGLFNTTIHLSARVRQRMRAGDSDPDAIPDTIIGEALRTVGPPSLYTAVILSLGFAIFTRSQFPDLKIFGILSTTTLLVGFLSDLIVTPALLRTFYCKVTMAKG